jgi:hypothetical protein
MVAVVDRSDERPRTCLPFVGNSPALCGLVFWPPVPADSLRYVRRSCAASLLHAEVLRDLFDLLSIPLEVSRDV